MSVRVPREEVWKERKMMQNCQIIKNQRNRSSTELGVDWRREGSLEPSNAEERSCKGKLLKKPWQRYLEWVNFCSLLSSSPSPLNPSLLYIQYGHTHTHIHPFICTEHHFLSHCIPCLWEELEKYGLPSPAVWQKGQACTQVEKLSPIVNKPCIVISKFLFYCWFYWSLIILPCPWKNYKEKTCPM